MCKFLFIVTTGNQIISGSGIPENPEMQRQKDHVYMYHTIISKKLLTFNYSITGSILKFFSL
jgi:hypothetical protein